MRDESLASGGARWTTRANALTAARLIMAPACACAILAGHAAAAGALFALAVASDLLDGPVARRFGESTPLGGLLDHASDATFCTSCLGALAASGAVPVLLPVLVAAAFLQYALDSGVLRRSGLRASPLGRWNGIAYFAMVGIPVVRDALGLGWPGAALVHGLGMALVATTLFSMFDRALVLLRTRRGRR